MPNDETTTASDPRAKHLRQAAKDWATPPTSLISKLPKGGTQLDYVGHADITLILIDVDPFWNYDVDLDDNGRPDIQHVGKRYVLWGTFTMFGVTRRVVGTCEDRKAEPEKELIGDLIRNGAMRFGIATKLWSKLDDATDPSRTPDDTPSRDTPMDMSKFDEACARHGLDRDDVIAAAGLTEPIMNSQKSKLMGAFNIARSQANATATDEPEPPAEPEPDGDEAHLPLEPEPEPEPPRKKAAAKKAAAKKAAADTGDNPRVHTAKVRQLNIRLSDYLGKPSDDERYTFCSEVVGREVTSTNDLTVAEIDAIIARAQSDE